MGLPQSLPVLSPGHSPCWSHAAPGASKALCSQKCWLGSLPGLALPCQAQPEVRLSAGKAQPWEPGDG